MTVWPLVPLGDLAAPVRHACVGGPFGSELTSKDYVAAPGVPIIRGGNLGEHGVFKDESFVFVSDEKAESLRANQAVPGDVIFTQRGTIGQVAAIPKAARFDKYVISQSQMKLTPDPGRVESRYLVHYFLSPPALRFLAENTLATGVPHINLSILKRIPVPLPPIAEQRRIADILDKADAIRRKRKEAIALTEELLRSAFLEMFGDPVTNPKRWPVASLGEIASEMTYGTSEKCNSTEAPASLPVLRIPNVAGGVVVWNELKYAKLSENEVKKLLLTRGDLLFVRSNGNPAYIARCAVYDDPRPALFASYLIRVRLSDHKMSLPIYVQAALSADSYRSVLTASAQTTAGNYNISTQGLRRLEIPLPPVAQQSRYAELRGRIERLAVVHGKALVEAEALFASLLHRAFRGELTAPTPKSTTPHKKQLSFLE